MTDNDISKTFGDNAPDIHAHMRAAVGICIERIEAVREMNTDTEYGRNHVKIPTVKTEIRDAASETCQLMLQTAQLVLTANKTQPLHGASSIDILPLKRYAEGGTIHSEEITEMRTKLPLGMETQPHSSEIEVVSAEDFSL